MLMPRMTSKSLSLSGLLSSVSLLVICYSMSRTILTLKTCIEITLARMDCISFHVAQYTLILD